MTEGTKDSDHCLLASYLIGLPHLRRHRRRVIVSVGSGIVPAVHHHTTQSEMDQIGPLVTRPRSVLTEWSDAGVHQARVRCTKVLVADCPVLKVPGWPRIDNHIDCIGELAESPLILWFVQIENNATLAEVEMPEVQASIRGGIVAVERSDFPRPLSSKRLHFDDVSSKTRKKLSAVLADLIREF